MGHRASTKARAAPLIFANADVVTDDIISKIGATDHRAVVLDLEAVYEVDTEGTDTLLRLHGELDARGIAMVLARAHGDVLGYMARDASLEAFGPDAVFDTVRDAVDALTGGTRP